MGTGPAPVSLMAGERERGGQRSEGEREEREKEKRREGSEAWEEGESKYLLLRQREPALVGVPVCSGQMEPM